MATKGGRSFSLGGRGRRKSQRRSSILKSAKPLDDIQNTSHDGYAKDRRVSFSHNIQIKEFVKDSTALAGVRQEDKEEPPKIQMSTPTKADGSRRLSGQRLGMERLSIIPVYEEASSLDDLDDFKPYSDTSPSPTKPLDTSAAPLEVLEPSRSLPPAPDDVQQPPLSSSSHHMELTLPVSQPQDMNMELDTHPSHHSLKDMELTLPASQHSQGPPSFLVVPEISRIGGVGTEGDLVTEDRNITGENGNGSATMSLTELDDQSRGPDTVMDTNMEVDIESLGAEGKDQGSLVASPDSVQGGCSMVLTFVHNDAEQSDMEMTHVEQSYREVEVGGVVSSEVVVTTLESGRSGTGVESAMPIAVCESDAGSNTVLPGGASSAVSSSSLAAGSRTLTPSSLMTGGSNTLTSVSTTVPMTHSDVSTGASLPSISPESVSAPLSSHDVSGHISTAGVSSPMSLCDTSITAAPGDPNITTVLQATGAAGSPMSLYEASVSHHALDVSVPGMSPAVEPNSALMSFCNTSTDVVGASSTAPMSLCEMSVDAHADASALQRETAPTSCGSATPHTPGAASIAANPPTTVSSAASPRPTPSSNVTACTPSHAPLSHPTAVAVSACATPVMVSASKPPLAPPSSSRSSRSGKRGLQASTTKKFSLRSALGQQSPKVHSLITKDAASSALLGTKGVVSATLLSSVATSASLSTVNGAPVVASSTPLVSRGRGLGRRTPVKPNSNRITRSTTKGSHDMVMSEGYVGSKGGVAKHGGGSGVPSQSTRITRSKARAVDQLDEHQKSFDPIPRSGRKVDWGSEGGERKDREEEAEEGMETSHIVPKAPSFVLGVGVTPATPLALPPSVLHAPALPGNTMEVGPEEEGNWLQDSDDSFVLQASGNETLSSLVSEEISDDGSKGGGGGERLCPAPERMERAPDNVPAKRGRGRKKQRRSLGLRSSVIQRLKTKTQDLAEVEVETPESMPVGQAPTATATAAVENSLFTSPEVTQFDKSYRNRQSLMFSPSGFNKFLVNLKCDQTVCGDEQEGGMDVVGSSLALAGHQAVSDADAAADQDMESGLGTGSGSDQDMVTGSGGEEIADDPAVCVEVVTSVPEVEQTYVVSEEEGGVVGEQSVAGTAEVLSSTFTVGQGGCGSAESPAPVVAADVSTAQSDRSETPPLPLNHSPGHGHSSHLPLPPSPTAPRPASSSCTSSVSDLRRTVSPSPLSSDATPPLSPVTTGPLQLGGDNETSAVRPTSFQTSRNTFITHVHSLRSRYQVIGTSCQARLANPEYLRTSSHPLFKSLLESILTRANLGLSLLTALIDYGNVSALARGRGYMPSEPAPISEYSVEQKFQWMEAMHREVEQKYADIQAVMMSAAEVYHWQVDLWNKSKVQLTVHNSAKITLNLEESPVSTYPQKIKSTNVRYVRGSLLFSKPQTEACTTTADIVMLLWTIIRYRGNS